MQTKPVFSIHRIDFLRTEEVNIGWWRRFITKQAGGVLVSFTVVFGLMLGLSGCGSGGYAGGGIVSLSKSAIVLDAGQSMTVTAAIADSAQVSWSLPASGCGSQGCGTLSASTGDAVTYTAPSGIASPVKLMLTASVPNTKDKQMATIMVNPDPKIAGAVPSGTVGTAYSTTLTDTGGTGALTLSLASGSLPPGLKFDASTGVLSGTPTAPGTYNFVVQVTDASDVPDTVSASESVTIVQAVSPLTVTGGAQPAGVVGSPYSTALKATGGVTPYAWSIAAGSLPNGLTINASSGVISGTPTAQGSFHFTVEVTDTTGKTATATASIAVTTPVPALALTTTGLPSGTVGVAYSATIGVTGGTSPYSCSITSGTLPAGLSMSGCTVSGTPITAGTSTVQVQVTDSGSPQQNTSGPETITINPAPLLLTTTALPNGTVGIPYSATIGVTGGTSPYNCSITSGTLPAGLSLSGCTVSGTPTTAGTSTVQVQVTDSGSPQQNTSGPETITISSAALTLTTTALPNGTVGIPYSATIGVTGGTSPYNCSITSGTLPAGLSLSGCTVSGTPTTAGTSTVQVQITDASSPQQSTTGPETITIKASTLSLTTSALPNGQIGIPYSATIGVSGGTSPYSCSITSGTLPAGLSLSGCTVSGTPTTAGTSTVQVQVTDASSPQQTTSGPETITIGSAALSLTSGTLPDGTVNVPYSATIGVTGGTSPYSCTITSGTLPAGLSLSGCTVSGTPTTSGTSTVQVKVTDSSSPQQSTSGPESITIHPAALTLTTTALPNGTVGTPYSATIGVTGGTSPYSCSITSGTLPAGLSLSGCTVSGTPTIAGTSTVQVKVTDSSSPQENTSGPESIKISPAPMSLTTSALPNGTVGTPYSATIGVTGGTSPYSCTITSGTLPAGLSLSGCTVSGTPTTAGTSTVQVKVTDSSSPQENTSGSESIKISPAPMSLTTSALPNGTVGTPYSATIGVTGGTSPYSCSITSGTLPAGLSLSGCTVSGTPTTAGTSTVQVKVTDSSSPQENTSGPESIKISPAPLKLTESVLPDGTVGVPYSATIGVTGGTSPYSCSITSGTLPAGLSLSGCTVSGTPTTAGTSTVQVKVTDSGSPQQSTTGPETITIKAASLAMTTSTLPDGTVNVPYSATIGVTGGTSPYSCSITSGTLPAGLSLSGCTVSGTPTTAGTSTVQMKVTDASSPQQNVAGPQTITIHPAGALSLTGTLPNATLGVAYSQQLNATGGQTPYSYSVTAGSLPAGLTLSASGAITGTPTAAGASVFTVTVTDSSATPETATNTYTLLVVYPTTPNDSKLKGPYAYLFQGYDDVASGVVAYQTASVGAMTADGTGVISSGEQSGNHQSSNPTGTTVGTESLMGTYTIGSDNTGTITITTFNADGSVDQTHTYAVSLTPPVAPATTYSQGGMIEYDGNQTTGTRGSGQLMAQTTSAFTTGLHGTYAFGFSGDTSCLVSCTVGIGAGPVATVGEFAVDGAGSISSGSADANIAGNNFPNAPLQGAYQPADSDGQVQLTMTNTSISDGTYPVDYVAYIVNASELFVMSTDKHSSYTLLSGTAKEQTQSTFDNTSMDGPVIGYENAQVNPGLLGVTLQDVLGSNSATIFRVTANGAGSCNTTNADTAGLTGLVNSLGGSSNLLQALLGTYDATGTSVCQTSSNGRGVLNYPTPSSLINTLLSLLGLPQGPPAPRVYYLVSPGNGYFLESGYAALGYFESQTGSPFSLASLNGTYVYNTIAAASLASTNASGTITFDGNGNATETLSQNVGVGNINILQTGGTPTATTYSLSNPNGTDSAANTGRYLLGDGVTVVYAISPSRLVILDTSATQTSPSVSLAY